MRRFVLNPFNFTSSELLWIISMCIYISTTQLFPSNVNVNAVYTFNYIQSVNQSPICKMKLMKWLFSYRMGTHDNRWLWMVIIRLSVCVFFVLKIYVIPAGFVKGLCIGWVTWVCRRKEPLNDWTFDL